MERIDAISRWIRDQVERAGAKGVVLGLSGGIDSAVVAALAQRSLGDNVLGLILPCHSHKEDEEDALRIASHLHMETITIDLTPLYDNLRTTLPPADKHITANLKPRFRMTVLYYVAGLRNYLVAGTGNKCEIAVGYFTKYGDGGVDLLPLGDLFKSEVKEIARTLGLPEDIIAKPPSAGLLPGQTDEGELKITYDELEQVLLAMMSKSGKTMPREVCARVEELIKKSEHKKAPIPIFKNS
jgi:NAD+ synthase